MMGCNLILMASLPTTWLVVGIVLLVLLLVAVLLLVVKSREAYLLKKEVAELRETMLMMRYEEANLSRMLHKADKAEQIVAPTAEMLIAEVEADEVAQSADELEASEESEVVTELPELSELEPSEDSENSEPSECLEQEAPQESAEEESLVEESLVEESLVEEPAIEEPVAEESIPEEPVMEEPVAEVPVAEVPVAEVPVVEESVAEEPAAEESVAEEPITDGPIAEESHAAEPVIEAPVVEQPVTPRPRKHAINERRPAIPNDLFAAWFEEQDNQKSQEESLHEELLVEEQTIEPVATEVNVASPVELATESAVEPLLADETDAQVSSEPKVLSKEDEKFCRKLERIVHTRMHNPNLNVDVIAAQFGMGRTNFYRKVREITSVSPNDYLRQCRMERASELLRTTDLSVTEICGQVGIPDAQYFSRVFKSFYGTPPSAYREQQ